MNIENGTVIIVDALRWNDGWEFDCPGLILSPVIKYYDNGASLDSMIEDLCIDASANKSMVDEDIKHEFEWRGWNLQYFKKVFKDSLHGKKYPKRDYQTLRQKVKFFIDEHDELNFMFID